MKRLIWISAIVFMLFTTVACGTDDPEKEHFKTSFDDQFGYLATADGSGTVVKVGTATLEFDFDNNVATVAVDDVMAQGMTMNFLAREVPFTTDDNGIRHIDAGNSGNPGVVAFHLDYWPPVLHDGVGEKLHGMFLKLTLTSGNTLTIFPYHAIAVGTTETTSPGNAPFVSTRPVYDITLDPAHLAASIDVERAAFSADMPTLGTMHFEGNPEDGTSIRLSLNPDGYTLSCAALSPSINNVPYDRFMIRNLTVDASFGSNNADIRFNCMAFSVNAAVCPLSVKYIETK